MGKAFIFGKWTSDASNYYSLFLPDLFEQTANSWISLGRDSTIGDVNVSNIF